MPPIASTSSRAADLRRHTLPFPSPALATGNIREYYSDDAEEMKPGRKGIALTTEQWAQLCESAAAIDALVDEMTN
jgi:hypothetical protein